MHVDTVATLIAIKCSSLDGHTDEKMITFLTKMQDDTMMPHHPCPNQKPLLASLLLDLPFRYDVVDTAVS